MSERQVNEMMSNSLQNLNLLIDSSKVVGTPLTIEGGKLLIPISKITYGFGVGGSEFTSKDGKIVNNNLIDSTNYPFGGGTVGGVNISPIGFILINENNCQILKVEQGDTLFDKLFDLFITIMKKSKQKPKE